MHSHQVKQDALISACVVTQVPMFPMQAVKPQPKAQWLSDRVLDSRPGSCRFESHWRHCIVSLSKHINPSLVLVQSRKTNPYITENVLMGRKESIQTNKLIIVYFCKLHRAFVFLVHAYRLLEDVLARREKYNSLDFVTCKQHRCRQSCACAQTDQRL